MDILLHIDLNLFCLLLLAFIVVNGYTRLGWQSMQYKLFMGIVMSTAICIISDTFTWVFDGVDTFFGYAVAVVSNILLFGFGAVPPFLWILYVYSVTSESGRFPRKILAYTVPPLVLNAVLSIASPLTHTLYYFTPEQFYQRGPGYLIHPIISVSYIIYGLVITVISRRKIEYIRFRTLLLFPVAPVIGAVFQVCFFGLTTTWSLLTFAILLTYVNIQDSRLDIDYLTGAYNRRFFERYLKHRIQQGIEKANKCDFAVLFADLDGFKSINDSFGHGEGDNALVEATSILKKHVCSGDVLARYAGDEFVLVIELNDRSGVPGLVEAIEQAVNSTNFKSPRRYTLSISVGYCLFDPQVTTDVHQMVRMADISMLERKGKMKNIQEARLHW